MGIEAMIVKSGNEERIFKYVTDCFGSVIEVKEIVDGVLESRLKCSYDAWGNRTVSGGTSITFNDGYSILMSNLNPFYYRGYYYDIDTKFYYLQTRYYDPALGRFINPDTIDYLDPESINGLNLYAYCNNNPVMYSDPSGHLAILATALIGAAIGAFAGVGFNVGKQLINNGWNFSEVDWGSAVNSGIVGAALGFSLAMGVGYLGPIIAGTAAAGSVKAAIGAFAASTAVSFGAGAIGYASEEWINGRPPSLKKTMAQGAFVALEGMVNFGIGGVIGGIGNVGTRGKVLASKEWWGKLFLGLMFTQPFKTSIDLIRNNI